MAAVVRATSLGLALVVLAAACSGSSEDKAGGSLRHQRVVLTLANPDPDPSSAASAEFVAAVERIAGDSIRINVRFGWRAGEAVERAENGTVSDVRRGDVDLAVVPARAIERLGVPPMRALLAPFLVDSLALEQRVITGDLGRRLLGGVERLGVVGIALLPGELRYPLGTVRPLLGPADYAGATMAVRRTPTADATFAALGASARAYRTGALSDFDGAEVGTGTIAYNGYDRRARALTANVVFWPRPVTVVMNRASFGALAPAQREVLRRAGLEAAGPLVTVLRHDTATWLAGVCRGTRLALVRASPVQRAALRAVVAPVYQRLERDPVTRTLISQIRSVRTQTTSAPDIVRCPAGTPAAQGDVAPLEGRWQATLTRPALSRSGASPGLADALRGSWTLEFSGRRFTVRREGGGEGTGTYTVDGSTIRFVFERGVAVRRGEAFVGRWSVYRDTLTFTPVPGRPKLTGLDVEPFERVR
jgi:TRAP-type C4-dicarboxylate transport system substrate-binding protein